MRITLSILVLASLLVVAPSGVRLRAEGEPQVLIRIATMVPRTQEFALAEKRANQRLGEATNGRIQYKMYYGGSAGDDTTVMRKLRSGQIDAAPLGTEVVSQFVRQCTVLIAPQTFFNYRQVDAVREELSPVFNEEAYGNGFKVLSWWDAGRVRIFSKRPIKTFQDLRSGRPWLYPQSALLREFYKMINVTGVPLEVSEVYGGLTTDMIDTVWISSVLGAQLRWAGMTKYVSPPVNVIQGAFLVRRPTWEKFSKEDQETVERLTSESSKKTQEDLREGDERAYKKLQSVGIKATEFDELPAWRDAGQKLRTRMIGRIYTKELLDRVESITKKYSNEGEG